MLMRAATVVQVLQDLFYACFILLVIAPLHVEEATRESREWRRLIEAGWRTLVACQANILKRRSLPPQRRYKLSIMIPLCTEKPTYCSSLFAVWHCYYILLLVTVICRLSNVLHALHRACVLFVKIKYSSQTFFFLFFVLRVRFS